MTNKPNKPGGRARKNSSNCETRISLSPGLARLVARTRRQQLLRSKTNPIVLENCNNIRSNTNTNANPAVLLPLGLGSINVPSAARRVDVRFNCVSSRLPTGHITHRLVVNVDVTYNPGADGKASSASSKSRNFPDAK